MLTTLRQIPPPHDDTSTPIDQIDRMVERARRAQHQVAAWDQARIDRAVAAVGWHALQPETLAPLGRAAVVESGIGDVGDSHDRIVTRVRGVMCDLHGQATFGPVDADPRTGIVRFAKPVGLVGVLVPSTAPVAAILMNVLVALKTRNAVVLCPNPAAKETCAATVEVIAGALRAVGAPPELVQAVREPSRAAAAALARHSDLVIATGGAATVRRAISAGTPAYAAGPGNANVIVDATADVGRAAELIVAGKAFDNGTSCSSESNLVVVQSMESALLDALVRRGVHLCTDAEGERLRTAVWSDGQLSRAIVGRPAPEIAVRAGIDLAEPCRVLAARLHPDLATDPLAGEKLSPVLGLVTVETFGDALQTVQRLTAVCGIGHSCGIHTADETHAEALAAKTPVGRVMVNQSTGGGNTGSFGNGMPFSSTVSCGTWGGSTITENVNWRHFLNYTWMSTPIARPVPTWDELVAPYRAG